jgi:hypothetical protein
MNESEEDQLIEEWHELARAVEVGAPLDLSTATGVLNEVLRTFAPTLRGPCEQADILSSIASARQSEKAWNMRLGQTLIDAGGARKRNDLAMALTVLDQFAAQCPWTPFSKIARDQRENYAASQD